MQTIKLDTNKLEWARGRNGMFKPAKIEIISSLKCLVFSVSSSKPGKIEPIMISLKRKSWIQVLKALGEELGK